MDNLSWGWPGVPLLPRTLRDRWREDTVPDWVAQDLNLSANATLASLDAGALGPASPANERLLHYLAFLIQSRQQTIRSLKSVDRPWPAGLAFFEVPWRNRTRNCLLRHGLHHRLSDLPYLTFGELLDFRSMGVLSILDFCCTLETAIERAVTSAAAPAGSVGRVGAADAGVQLSKDLLEAMDEPWANMVSEQDPRFRNLLPPGRGTVAERIDELTSNLETSDEQLELLVKSLPHVRARISELEKEPLDICAANYLALVGGVTGGRLRALAARLHWSGDPAPKTLEESGTMAGVTRERVRQLETRALRDLRSVAPGLELYLRT